VKAIPGRVDKIDMSAIAWNAKDANPEERHHALARADALVRCSFVLVNFWLTPQFFERMRQASLAGLDPAPL
jgi:hypothetical protein